MPNQAIQAESADQGVTAGANTSNRLGKHGQMNAGSGSAARTRIGLSWVLLVGREMISMSGGIEPIACDRLLSDVHISKGARIVLSNTTVVAQPATAHLSLT